MSIFKCKMCGGRMEVGEKQTVATCDYCGTYQTLPKLDDERRTNMFDRANHFRRNNEFDKASGIYEQILNEDSMDAEAYWSLVLCRYGVEYVEEPSSRKRIPTINRAQYTSIFDDENYKSAIKYSDTLQRSIYESEAKIINDIQKNMLAISQKEEPFDVFICYKETDRNGRRTPDSVIAQELYNELTRDGFKVFFSRITLEDKLGSAYEPYIFAALNSAKVMVVVGTQSDYFNAVWVKNEWRRFLALIKNGAKKTLIPAYRDMDPYDLPEEFSHLQAQDMSKLGYMQDLVRGIRKIIESYAPKVTVKETVSSSTSAVATAPNLESLLKRAFMFLEDGNFTRADEMCEQVLNQDPENGRAYLGKLMIDLQAKNQNDLINKANLMDKSEYYKNVLRFADSKLVDELKSYVGKYHQRKSDNIYYEATRLMSRNWIESYEKAIELLKTIPGWKDADKLIDKCYAGIAQKKKDNQDQTNRSIYRQVQGKMIQARVAHEEGRVRQAVDYYDEAKNLLIEIEGWQDSHKLKEECIAQIRAIYKEKEDRDEEYKRKIHATERRAIRILTPILIAVTLAILVVFFVHSVLLDEMSQLILFSLTEWILLTVWWVILGLFAKFGQPRIAKIVAWVFTIVFAIVALIMIQDADIINRISTSAIRLVVPTLVGKKIFKKVSDHSYFYIKWDNRSSNKDY